ncbi:MAG TPA: ABC transporter permease [Solirubrobacterales bacterium]|nr:ABC transporter permease [Solirubrobacterales bacterium]
MSEVGAVPELREVKGPSALAGGPRRFFDLLWLMASTEFKRTYFGTVLGYVWSLVRPLLLFAVLLFVFTKIIRLGSDVPNYAVLLLLSIVLFTFFSEATQAAVGSVVGQEGVVRKTQFPRLVIPLAVVLTAFFNLCLNLLVVLAFVLLWGVDPTWSWLLFPVGLLALFVFTTAVSVLLSVLYVRFRDVMIIWAVLSQVLFYATPVIYPIEIVPEAYRDLLLINPLAPIFEQIRVWVLDPAAPTATDIAGGWAGLVPAAAIFVVTCVLAAWIFNRDAPRIAEDL